MLAVSGTSLESRPQPIIIYDRTFRLLQLYCSVLLSNIIRKWSRLSLVNISVTWLSPALWLVRSQFYWVTLRKWSLLLCLQTRGERDEGFPSPWNAHSTELSRFSGGLNIEKGVQERFAYHDEWIFPPHSNFWIYIEKVLVQQRGGLGLTTPYWNVLTFF